MKRKKTTKANQSLMIKAMSSKAERGERLKRLRLMAGFSSRKAFENKYNISANTLRSWEDGIHTGLTEQGAKRILLALRSEGIRCSVGWLLQGVGNGPDGVVSKLFENEELQDSIQNVEQAQSKNKKKNKTDMESLQAELATFCNLHDEAIYLEVTDDGMEPFYKQSDYVAGIRYYDEEITEAAGKNCIIETQSGESSVRQLRLGSKPGYYNLICLNTQTALQTPILYDAELVYAAPVIWHRVRISK